MGKAEQRDFHIDDWSILELQRLFDYPTSESQLHARSTKEIGKATKKGDAALAAFLRRAVSKLQNDPTGGGASPVWTTQLGASTAAALGNEYFPSDAQTVTVTGPARENTTKVLTNEEIKITRAPAERVALNQQTTFSSEANQGTINPILRQEYERILSVDSRYRPNILPYPKNAYSVSSSTNFHTNISECLHNVVSIKLQSITVPRVWNNFSAAIGNTVLGVEAENTIHWYYLPDMFISMPITAQVLPIEPVGIANSPHIDLRIDDTGKSTLTTTSPSKCRLVLYTNDMPMPPDGAGCRMNSTPNCNLGTSLGFIPTDLNVDTGTVYGGDIKQPADTPPLVTSVPIELHPIRHFIVVLDDFNTNRINNSLIGIAGTETRIQPSSSIPFRPQPGNKPCRYFPTVPRTKTQSQLYAANVKLQSLSAPNTQNQEPCPSSVLALCPVPQQRSELGEILTLTGTGVNSTAREYFGPVDLQKIHVKLLDNAGNYVNLQGRDWSMSLVVTQLYQY